MSKRNKEIREDSVVEKKEEEIVVNSIVEEKKEDVIVPEKRDNRVMGMIISRKDHPIYLSYNGEGLVVPPRGKKKNINKNLLGALPKNVVFVPYSN